MHIDLRSLSKGRSTIDQKVLLTPEQIQNSNVVGEVECHAVFHALQSQIHATVSFSCNVNSDCSMCTRQIIIPISGEYNLFLKNKSALSHDTGEEDIDYYFTDSDKTLDTRQTLYEEIILAYPIKPLCSENCECAFIEPIAGKKPEKESRPIDPRWEALKKLTD